MTTPPTPPDPGQEPPPGGLGGIRACPMDHHFLGDTCPSCHLPATSHYDIRPGDCIDCSDCSAFCPHGAYACNQPHPLN